MWRSTPIYAAISKMNMIEARGYPDRNFLSRERIHGSSKSLTRNILELIGRNPKIKNK